MNIFQVLTSHRTPISINCHYVCSKFGRGKRKKSSTQCVLSQIECAVGRVKDNGCLCLRPLHLSSRHGMVAVTRLLLEKGASVLAVDCNGMTPALACAPDPNVAECLAIILSMYPSVTLLTQQPNNFQKGESNNTKFPFNLILCRLLCSQSSSLILIELQHGQNNFTPLIGLYIFFF